MYESWNKTPNASKKLTKMLLRRRRLIDALTPERSENEMRRELDLLHQTLEKFPSPRDREKGGTTIRRQ